MRDQDDACPEDPEDIDGFEDADGCPDPDNDKDGILDAEDKCPTAAETINGRDDDDGCPDEGAVQVHIGEKELDVLQPVFFKTNRFRIRHRFFNILNQIALTLKAHPEIGRCAVEGHADATGPADWNKRLSMMRAESVVEYLVRRGVDANRLTPLGQGDQKPWADNETEEGRARNRRVVFHIEGVWSSRPPSERIKVMDRGPGESELNSRASQDNASGKDKAGAQDNDGQDKGEVGSGGRDRSRADVEAHKAGPGARTDAPRPAASERARDGKPSIATSTAPKPEEDSVRATDKPQPTNPLKARTLREAVQLPSATAP